MSVMVLTLIRVRWMVDLRRAQIVQRLLQKKTKPMLSRKRTSDNGWKVYVTCTKTCSLLPTYVVLCTG